MKAKTAAKVLKQPALAQQVGTFYIFPTYNK
jgi:hypothetical protein